MRKKRYTTMLFGKLLLAVTALVGVVVALPKSEDTKYFREYSSPILGCGAAYRVGGGWEGVCRVLTYRTDEPG